MWSLIEDGSITKHLSGNRGITIGDIQYSRNIFSFRLSNEEREAIWLYEVIHDKTNKKHDAYYTNTDQSFAFAGGKITASYGSATAKAHADTTWTQDEIDAGKAPAGADTDTVAVEGAFICIEINFNGSHTFAWNAIFNFAADAAPTTTDTDGKTDILVFRYNGAIWQEVGRTLNIPES